MSQSLAEGGNIIEEKVTKVNGQVSTRRYEKKRPLGKGGFASCFLVENIETKRQYAAKIISKTILVKPKTKQKLLSEIRIHKSVSHKNIVQFYHVFENQYNVYILLEVCSNSNMFELIRERKKLTIPQVQYYIYQLIQALSYLHHKTIIHRDVKLGNLFINDKMELKLGDFGLASKLQFSGERKRTVCGTPNYIAPQIIENSKGHSYEVDVWSTGVIMYIFLTGRPPFETDNIQKTYDRIKAADYKIPSSLTNQSAIDLLRKILVTDPAKRISFDEILEHSFMNPLGGILKELPPSSLKQVPNLRQCIKYSEQEMKSVTKMPSMTTIQTSMQQNIEVIEEKSNDERSRNSSAVQRFKNFLKSENVSEKARSSSSSQLIKSKDQRELIKNQSSTYISVRDSGKQTSRSSNSLSKSANFSSPIVKKKDIYVTIYNIEVVISYSLSNGLIGTYEPNYKLLYSRRQKVFYQIINDIVKKIPSDKTNEQINNRKKYLLSVKPNEEEPQPSIVYIKKALKTKEAILFKLSNGTIQANFVSQSILLITNDQLVLMPKGKDLVREKKDNYLESKNLQLVKSYRIVMEINNKSKG